jgi:hypothetical protein
MTLTLHDGQWSGRDVELGYKQGTYSIEGDHVAFEVQEGLILTFTFSVDADHNLRLKAVEPMERGDRFYVDDRRLEEDRLSEKGLRPALAARVQGLRAGWSAGSERGEHPAVSRGPRQGRA